MSVGLTDGRRSYGRAVSELYDLSGRPDTNGAHTGSLTACR